MRANKKWDSRPEVRLRSELHARGLRFRKHSPIRASGIVVRPDITFPVERLAIFVDGCFWHACPDHGTRPRKNSLYWRTKLDRNVVRDRRVDRALSDNGWSVLRLWEHVPPGEAADQIVKELRSIGRPGPQPRGKDAM
jgi:DNA mismatch endonuclease (patch repair protein)